MSEENSTLVSRSRNNSIDNTHSIDSISESGKQKQFAIDPKLDYGKLIEQFPLIIIDVNKLAPSLRVKLVKEPNVPLRNAESRERYNTRVDSQL